MFKTSFEEVTTQKRGFEVDDVYFKKHIEGIGRAFVTGYNTSLIDNNPKITNESLNQNIENKLLGFAFEGAAMGLVINDFFNPLNRGFENFLSVAHKHEYMLYVGAGWAVVRLPFKRMLINKLKRNILHSLVYDGIGFHEGYFNWRRSIVDKKIPKYLKKNEYKFYYQGLGRSLWFVLGGNAKKINQTINSFDCDKKEDLWSGVGLAATYAGGREDTLFPLKELSKDYYPCLAQGSTFASKARLRADNVTVQNKYACKIFCDMTIEEAAKITDDCLNEMDLPDYSLWQSKIKKVFA